MVNRKPTGFDSAWVTSSGHFTLHSIQLFRSFREMLSEMFVFLRHCAFTADRKEITVNNFASTFDSADHSS